MKNEKIKLFSMFSGYGGAEFALKKVKIPFECIGYSEIKNSAIEIYEQNFSGIKNYGDCTKINSEELPDFDLLTAGFPCKDVSIAGKNDLSKGRTTLFSEIIRIVKDKEPKYMLLENVKGILQKRHSEFYNYIISELNRTGYLVHTSVLNSKDYGLPHNRERVFFVCFRKDLENEFNKFKFPEKEELKIFVKDIIDYNSKHEKIKNKRIDKILNSPTKKENPIFELKGDTPSGISRQTDRIYTTISPCLNCVQKENKFFINGKVIVLNGKEQFRLMGFLNDEINLGSLSENKLKDLTGDGWDINLVSKIFQEMFKNE